MESRSGVTLVAQRAKEVFLEIRSLRKSMPQRTRVQRDEFEAKKKELERQWWEYSKPFMKKDEVQNEPL